MNGPDSGNRRKTDGGWVDPSDYFSGSRRFRDNASGEMIVNVHAGDCFVTDKKDEIATTVLGSCIAACIRDPIAKVGGMNHFLLPGNETTQSDSLRFGAFAMEQLINEILKRGGQRERLEIKIFGGGNVIKSSAMIGTKNADFVRDYLRTEGIPIVSEDVGGELPRKVRYYPVTGRAMVRKLQRRDDVEQIAREEVTYKKQIDTPKGGEESVELF